MGILITGMEMPNRCPECPYAYWTEGAHYDYCQAMGYDNKWKIYESDSRPDWCPLVPVPPHGRLIDADALIIALETQDYSCAPDTLEEWTPMDMTKAEIADIRNAPTIIPAEEGE